MVKNLMHNVDNICSILDTLSTIKPSSDSLKASGFKQQAVS